MPPPVSHHHQNPKFYVRPSSGFDEPPCSAASFVVNSEPHTGARFSVRLCVGLIRSKRPPNYPIGTLFWPQIIVLAWICSSELNMYDIIWRKKLSFQVSFKSQLRYLPSGSNKKLSL
jgi:hypothetical protein